MKKFPIDKMLCALERRADLVGVEIDADTDYVFICEVLTAFEFTGSLSYEFKEQVYFKLRKLFQKFNLDFGAMIAEILMGE